MKEIRPLSVFFNQAGICNMRSFHKALLCFLCRFLPFHKMMWYSACCCKIYSHIVCDGFMHLLLLALLWTCVWDTKKILAKNIFVASLCNSTLWLRTPLSSYWQFRDFARCYRMPKVDSELTYINLDLSLSASMQPLKTKSLSVPET